MKLFRLLAPAVAALALVAAPAARADGPYTITSSGLYGSSVAEVIFVGSGCDSTIQTSPLNGFDARILNISSKAGRAVTVTWSSPVPAGVGSLAASFYSTSCSKVGATIASPTAPGSWTFTVPVGAKWISVATAGKAGVSFTIV